MRAAEGQRRNQRQMERRAKPARRSSRFMYPKTAARRLHQSRCDPKNQNPQNGQLMARFDWGLGAICFGASPVAAVFGSAPGSATSPEHRIHSNPNPRICPSKQDISTLLGIGHFYFALTRSFMGGLIQSLIELRAETTCFGNTGGGGPIGPNRVARSSYFQTNDVGCHAIRHQEHPHIACAGETLRNCHHVHAV